MHLTCGTCGSDFDIEPDGSPTVTCPVCGSSVSVEAQTLELDDGAVELEELDGSQGALGSDGLELDLPPVTHASGPSARPRSPKPSSEESREARASQFTRPATVTISRRGGPNWRDYIGWGAFVAVVMIGASYIAYRRSLPPPPPQIANPIQKAADRWRDSGLEGMPVRDAIAIGKTKLERSRLERLDALETIKRGLITDANAAEAIALYARALASLPSARDEDSVSLALRGITASIGADPDSEYRADLEESRAWLLLEERRLDQARDAAARSMELSPTSPGSRLVRAATDAEFRAERSVETLRELTREPEVRNRAQRWLAVALLRSGELAEAIRILEQGAESAPNSDEMMRTLYQLRYAMGQERKARELLERLVETKNASVEDRVRLARELLSDGGDPQAALEVLDGGLAENVAGDRAAAQLYAEKIFVATRAVDFIVDPRELTQWLARGLELAPDSSAVLYARCLADTELDRREQALAGLEVANGLYPEIPEMAIDLAWRLRRVDAPAAREVIDDALISTLDSVPLYLMSALLELDGGRPVTAFQRLKRALAIDPELNLRRAHDRALPAPLEVYRQIGDELTSNGRDRRNAITSSGGAAAYYVAGDFRRASRALVQAIRIDRRSAPANLYTGILALRKNQRASAQRHINVAWEQDRGLPLVQIYHARLLENSDNLVKAELSYRDILHLNPSATSAQTGLARVLWRAGRRSEALAEVRKVLSVRPHDREALVFMAGAQGVMPAAGRRRSNR